MKMRWMAMVGAGALAALTGCGQDARVEELSRKADTQAARLDALQAAVDGLKLQLKNLDETQAAALQQRVAAAIQAQMSAMISSQVAARVEAKIGSEAEVNNIFQGAVRDAMADYEAKKEQEAAAERERRQAEREQRRQEWEQRQLAQLKETLGLNDQQVEQMQALSTSLRETMRQGFEELRNAGGFDPEKMRERAEQTRTEYTAKLQEILTAEQYEKLEQQPMMGMLLGGRGRGMRRDNSDNQAGGGTTPPPPQ